VISSKIGSGIRVLAARRGVPRRLADSPDVPGNGRGVPVGKDLPSDEHDLLPQAFRDLADAKIVPAAADADASSRFPLEALDPLNSRGLHAAHSPKRYGGEGADALAAVIRRGPDSRALR
jgi:alkylation response protein AidB-like acyl-CoA dehydrogenase